MMSAHRLLWIFFGNRWLPKRWNTKASRDWRAGARCSVSNGSSLCACSIREQTNPSDNPTLRHQMLRGKGPSRSGSNHVLPSEEEESNCSHVVPVVRGLEKERAKKSTTISVASHGCNHLKKFRFRHGTYRKRQQRREVLQKNVLGYDQKDRLSPELSHAGGRTAGVEFGRVP